MENLDYTFFDKCSSLSDAARKIFGKDDYRTCEKIKTIALEYGFDWKIWNERRKTKIVETVCLCCGSIIKQPNNKRLKKFCNSSCAAKYNNSKPHCIKYVKTNASEPFVTYLIKVAFFMNV